MAGPKCGVIKGATHRRRSVTTGVLLAKCWGQFSLIPLSMIWTRGRIHPQSLHTRLCGSADLLECRKALNGQIWTGSINCMRFNKAKGWVLPLGPSNPMQCYRLEGEHLESCLVGKKLWVPVNNWLNMSQRLPRWSRRLMAFWLVSAIVASSIGAMIIPLYSALGRLHLNSMSIFGPLTKKRHWSGRACPKKGDKAAEGSRAQVSWEAAEGTGAV